MVDDIFLYGTIPDFDSYLSIFFGSSKVINKLKITIYNLFLQQILMFTERNKTSTFSQIQSNIYFLNL